LPLVVEDADESSASAVPPLGFQSHFSGVAPEPMSDRALKEDRRDFAQMFFVQGADVPIHLPMRNNQIGRP
jgi:hypothetical protein